MPGPSIAAELSKVKFSGPPLMSNDDDWSSGDETESDVTEPDENAQEPEYYPDAIKWARYRDSRKDRGDGRIGWHYGVMWTGYLKQAWDTEEFIDQFELDDNGNNQLITDFWQAAGRPVSKTKTGRIREPKGAIGEVIEPPKELIKRWIKEARPRRSYKLFKIRREKEKTRQKIRKRDSDYYYHKRLLARAEAEKRNASELVSATSSAQNGDAGPSTQASRNASAASQIPSSTDVPKSKTSGKAVVKGKEKVKQDRPVDPALASLFDDEIVATAPVNSPKKKKKNKNKNKGRDPGISGTTSPDKVVVKEEEKDREKEQEKKRKRDSIPPPEKKKKGTSPTKQQFITPTPTIIPPASQPPLHEPSEGTSCRSAVSPTPPTIPRRIGQEPLFLDSAPSPADTFGEFMPGFFDRAPSTAPHSRVPSIQAKKEIMDLDLDTSVASPQQVVSGVSAGEDEDVTMVEALDDLQVELEPDLQPQAEVENRDKSRSKTPRPPVVEKAKAVSPTTTVAPATAPIGSRIPPSAISAPEKSTSPIETGASGPTSTEFSGPVLTAVTKDASPAPEVSAETAAPSAPEAVVPVAQAGAATLPPAEVTVGTMIWPSGEAGQANHVNNVSSDVPKEGATSASTLAIGDTAEAMLTTSPAPQVPVTGKTLTPEPDEADTSTMIPARTSPSLMYSPPLEPPVPTFTSPRTVSRSPSLPMDMDMDIESPIHPAEDESKPNPTSGISPPRYVLDSPVDQVLPLPEPVKPTSISPPTTAAKLPPSERPKYVQPSRVKILADVVDPEAAIRLAKKAAKLEKAQHAHPSLPQRPTQNLSTHESQGRPPVTAPTQPRDFGPTPPTGPSHGPGIGIRQSGPLADQKEMYKSNRPQPLSLPPWEKREHPMDLRAGISPLTAPAAPATMRTDQWRPIPPGQSPYGAHGGQSPHIAQGGQSPYVQGGQSPYVAHGGQSPYIPHGGQSPAWAPNAQMGVTPFGQAAIPGRSPMYGPNSSVPVAVDPRGGLTPNSAVTQPPAQAVDPRRRPSDQPGLAPGRSPLRETPMSPVADSASIGPRRITLLGHVKAYLQSPHPDTEDIRFNLKIMQGAFNGFNQAGDSVLAMVLADKSKASGVYMPMDEVDASLIGLQMRYGARLVQWAKVGGDGSSGAWEQFKIKAMTRGRAWVTFTENVAPDNTVIEHFAIIMAPAKFAESSILSLGLGPWTTVSEIGIALLVLAIPLDTVPPPSLPNPIRPDLDEDEDKKPSTLTYPTHCFASYGLTPEYFHSLRRTRSVRYPGQEGHYDVLHHLIEHEFSVNEVIPHDEYHVPENVLIMNNKFTRAVKSSTLDKTINRRTKYFAAGPALHLLPSQWKLREIWTTGGLVTFSPTFVLRSPEKVAEIMSMIRIAPNWAAYVTPQLVQWVHASWKMPARCPNPTQAYQTFTQSLFLDQHLLNMSGSAAGAGGGLAVSTCPPLISHSDRCARWMEWLQQISTTTDYQHLVDLCYDYVNDGGTKSNKMDIDQEPELELVDIEKKQLEDLTNMRKTPHLLPYRRFIYVGEVSLQKDKKEKYGAGIEFVAPDSFAAIFSGAI